MKFFTRRWFKSSSFKKRHRHNRFHRNRFYLSSDQLEPRHLLAADTFGPTTPDHTIDQSLLGDTAATASTLDGRSNISMLQSSSTASSTPSLLHGVQKFLGPGTPGPIEIFDGPWTKLLGGDEDASDPSLFAAARTYGEGRVFAAGHGGLFKNLEAYDNQVFAKNIFTWLTSIQDQKKITLASGHAEGEHGFDGYPAGKVSEIRPILENKNYSFTTLGGDLTPSRLETTSTLFIMNPKTGFSNTELSTLNDFVRDGGSLLLVGLGWYWTHYQDPDINTYPIQQVGELFGVRWLRHYITDATDNVDASPIFIPLAPDGGGGDSVGPEVILKDVDRVLGAGYPGPVKTVAGDWTVLLTGDSDASSPSTNAVARRYGQGRVVAVGDDNIFDDLNSLDNAAFATNAAKWLNGNGQKKIAFTAGHNEIITSYRATALTSRLASEGYTASNLQGSLTSEKLEDISVLVIGNARRNFSATEVSAIRDYVANGGGLWLLGLGWYWTHYWEPNISTYPMQQVGEPFGVEWLHQYITDSTNNIGGYPILVANKNHRPDAIYLSNSKIQENQPRSSLVGYLTGSDPDSGDAMTFSFAQGSGSAHNNFFEISGNRLLTKMTFNYEVLSSLTVRVRATDSSGLFVERPFNIRVTDIDETPASTRFEFRHINESHADDYLVDSTGMRKYAEWQSPPITYWGPTTNNVEGQLIYRFPLNGISTNAIMKANSPSWDFYNEPGGIGRGASSLEASRDGVNWVSLRNSIEPRNWGADWAYNTSLPQAVLGTAQIWIRMRFLVEGAPNSSYTVSQFGRATSATTEPVFALVATTGNASSPTGVSLSNNSISENAAIGTSVGTFETEDDDPNDSFTYTLVSGTGSSSNSFFEIQNNSLKIRKSLDYENQRFHSIRVRTTDTAGLFTEKRFIINVMDVDDAPTHPIDINLSYDRIPENLGQSQIGYFSSVFTGSPDDITYALVEGAGSFGNAKFVITDNVLQSAVPFDFETQSQYGIRVRATASSSGLFTEKVFIINILDVDDSPTTLTDIELSNSIIPENVAPGAIGSFSTVFIGPNDEITYSLITGNGSSGNSSFEVEDNELRSAETFDFETQQQYSIRVRATASNSATYTEKTFTIDIADRQENQVGIANQLAIWDTPGIGGGYHDNAHSGDAWAFDGTTVASQIRSGGVSAGIVKVWDIGESNDLIGSITIDEPHPSYSQPGGGHGDGFGDSIILKDGRVGIGNAVTAINATHDGHYYVFDTSNGNLLSDFNPSPHTAQYFGEKSVAGSDFFVVAESGNSQHRTRPAITVYDSATGLSSNSIYREVLGEAGTSSVSRALTVHGDNIFMTTSVGAYWWQVTRDQEGNAAGVVQVATLTNDSRTNVDRIAANDNYLVFSSPGSSTQAYLYQLVGDDIIFERTITAPDISSGDRFGTSLLLDGDILYVGAPRSNIDQAGTGKVFVYNLSDERTFSNPNFFTGSEVGNGDRFGSKLALANDLLAVSASGNKAFLFRSLTADDLETPISSAPEGIVLDSDTVLETAKRDDRVGIFATYDLDTNDTFTYALVAGEGSNDNSAFRISGNELLLNSDPDFESQHTYEIRVRTTDTAGMSFEKSFDIYVEDVNESPSVSLTDRVPSILENTDTSSPTRIATVTINDDALGTASINLQGPASQFFMIHGDGLFLKSDVNIDYEVFRTLSVAISASDPTLSDKTSVSFHTLTIEDVNEHPSILAFHNPVAFDEYTPIENPVRVAEIFIDDQLGSHEFSLSGPNASFFDLNGTELLLKPGIVLDYELMSPFSVDVTVTDTSLSPQQPLTQSFELIINDIDESKCLRPIDGRGSTYLVDDPNGNVYADGQLISIDGSYSSEVPHFGNIESDATWQLIDAEVNTDNRQNLLFGRHRSGLLHKFRATETWEINVFSAISNARSSTLSRSSGQPSENPNPIAENLLPLLASSTVTILRNGTGHLFVDTAVLMIGNDAVSEGSITGFQLEDVAVNHRFRQLLFVSHDRSAIIWYFNETWEFDASSQITQPNTNAFDSIEQQFNRDIDQDGLIGS